MKKLLTLLLVLCMCLSLAACGTSDSEGDGNLSKENSTEGSSSSDGKNTSDKNDPDAISFNEQTIVDNEHCTIRITGIDPDGFWGYTLHVYMENKSSDTTYMISVDHASINGVSSDPLFATEVAPGKKTNEEITFMEEFPEDIGKYSDILLSFKVYNSNDWLEDTITEAEAHIYPYGEASAIQFERPECSTDTVLVDNENVTIVVTGYRMDAIWGYTADLYISNKTDTEIMVSVDDVSVNGFMIDPYFSTSVPAGTNAFADISWYEDNLTANGITQVEEIEMKLQVYDYNDWLSDYIVEKTVTLNP